MSGSATSGYEMQTITAGAGAGAAAAAAANRSFAKRK